MFRVLLAMTFVAMSCSAYPALAAQAPNPAAVFCADQGGSYTIVAGAGGERGLCTLKDGTQLDAWDYFRQQHSEANDPGTPLAEADRIWSGGPMLTMVDGAMRAEALAEKGGIIITVGTTDQMMKFKGVVGSGK